MAQNDVLLAQAQTGIYSEPQPFQPSAQDRRDAQDVVRSTPVPTDRNAIYSLPPQINDVGGGKGNGYASADDAARAVAPSLYQHTRISGNEAGAWLVSKEVEGQERFFVVAASRGQNNELDFPQAKADLDAYRRQNPGENFTVVSHIHSHPNITRDAQGKPLGLIGEGVSANDYDIWRNASVEQDPKYRIQNKGYTVSGDGDVYRLDIPNQNTLSPAEQRGAPFGIFTARSTPTLSNIGDVALADETRLQPNLWGAIREQANPNVGQQATWLAPAQIRNEAKLLSDPTHPDHKMFQQALNGMDAQKITFGNPQEKENAAAALVYAARRDGIGQIDHVTASRDGQSLFAVQGKLGDPAALVTNPPVDKAQAIKESVENTSLRLLNDSPNFPPPKLSVPKAEGVNLDQPHEVAAKSRGLG